MKETEIALTLLTGLTSEFRRFNGTAYSKDKRRKPVVLTTISTTVSAAAAEVRTREQLSDISRRLYGPRRVDVIQARRPSCCRFVSKTQRQKLAAPPPLQPCVAGFQLLLLLQLLVTQRQSHGGSSSGGRRCSRPYRRPYRQCSSHAHRFYQRRKLRSLL